MVSQVALVQLDHLVWQDSLETEEDLDHQGLPVNQVLQDQLANPDPLVREEDLGPQVLLDHLDSLDLPDSQVNEVSKVNVVKQVHQVNLVSLDQLASLVL